MPKDFRTFLADYEAANPGMVVRISQEVSACWEASAIAVKAQKELREAPVLIFERLRTTDGRISPYPTVLNLFASRPRCAFALEADPRFAGQALYERRLDRVKPVVVSSEQAPVKEIIAIGDAIDVQEIPGVVHNAWDPGAYVSAGMLTTYDPESGVDNCALQRGWLYDQREIRVFPAGVSHNAWNLHKIEAAGEPARVAYWVGHHPLAYLGAEARMGYPESHWDAAGGVLHEPLRLVPSETLGEDFLVPADAEWVIEGRIPPGVRKPEGPFGEYTRYFGGQGLRPVMEVSCISHRRDAHWLSIIPGRADEGIGIAALRREGTLFDLLKRVVPQVINVYRPNSAPGHIYVQLRKTQDWQPRAVITAALSSSESIRHVFVFDEDIDIFDEEEIMWAIYSRSDWARDLVVIENMFSTELEPTTTGHLVGTRAGLDCTVPAAPAVYERRSFIPSEVMDRVKLQDYVPADSPAWRH